MKPQSQGSKSRIGNWVKSNRELGQENNDKPTWVRDQ